MKNILTVAMLLVAPTASPAVELITNGGFETGGFDGWTVNTRRTGMGDGSFFVAPNSGAAATRSGIGTAINPTGGMFFAISDQANPGESALSQSFTVPAAAAAVTLTFDWFLNDLSGFNPAVHPSGLDNSAGGTQEPNQHARIDILAAGAGAFSTAPADIVRSILAPVPAPGAGVNPWIASGPVDLTAALAPGGTYQIRFAEVDNLDFLNLGVDNVSISATAIPAPAALPLLLGGLGALAVAARRRERRA